MGKPLYFNNKKIVIKIPSVPIHSPNAALAKFAIAPTKSRANFCPSASLKFPNSKFSKPSYFINK